ncbi:MAG: hypothetical protein WD928_05175 [Gammaproteobacteria bacterium]
MSIAETLEQRMEDGKPVSRLQIIAMRCQLVDCIDQAMALESGVVPPAMRVTDADLVDGKVARLPVRSQS